MSKNRNRLIIITLFLAAALVAPIVLAQQDINEATIITFKLDWVSRDTTSFSNDLGYEISLDDGSLTTYSAELLACEESSLTSWFMPQTAHAGHGDEISEARTTQPLTESLRTQTAVLLETRTIAANNYCSIHVVIGPDTESETSTLQLSGSYLSSDQDTVGSFSFQTDLAWGQIYPLPTPIGTNETAVSITLQRDITMLFDSIDFTTDNDAEIEKALLRNIINSIRNQKLRKRIMKTKTATLLLFFICVIMTACTGTQQTAPINNEQLPVQNTQAVQPAIEGVADQASPINIASVDPDDGVEIVSVAQTETETAVFNTQPANPDQLPN